MQITVHPDLLAAKLLKDVGLFLAVGETPIEMLQEFGRSAATAVPQTQNLKLEQGEAFIWDRLGNKSPFVLRIAPSHTERKRHTRKYAEGELPPERSFYFRGPLKSLNLRAHHLILFLQIAAGVDDETWLYHLKQHDYSRWICEYIKDPDLATEIRHIENDASLSPQESRRHVREQIEQLYTLPAGPERPSSVATLHAPR